jgi:hypothetical protein
MRRVESQAIGVPGDVSLSSRVSIPCISVQGVHPTVGTSIMRFEEVREYLSAKDAKPVRSPDAARADKIMANKADTIVPFKPSV